MQDVLVYVSINFKWPPCNRKHSGPAHALRRRNFNLRSGVPFFSCDHRLEKFKKGVFILKTHQMFSVHTSLKKFENAATTGYFAFLLEENPHRFGKAPFWKCFPSTLKHKAGVFQIPRVWRMFSFEERPFAWQIIVDGRPNRRNKAVFSNFSCVVWTRPQ